MVIQGQKIVKNDQIYFSVKDFFVDFNIGHANIQLDNLFNGDKELGRKLVWFRTLVVLVLTNFNTDIVSVFKFVTDIVSEFLIIPIYI